MKVHCCVISFALVFFSDFVPQFGRKLFDYESFDNYYFLESEIPNADDSNAATKEPAEAPEVEKEPELSPEEQKGKWGLC